MKRDDRSPAARRDSRGHRRTSGVQRAGRVLGEAQAAAPVLVQVAAADASRSHAHEHLSRPWLRLRHVLDADVATGVETGLFHRSCSEHCRSITGEGVRQTLDLVEQHIALTRTEVPSGTPVFDWEVPNEWNIRDAWIADSQGRRVVDFRAHSLHVVSYSAPINRTMSRGELEPHLHSLPERPDWIPYRTSYYVEDWGFCLRHRDRLQLGPGPFEVVIDSDLRPGHLTYAEGTVRGSSPEDVLINTHTCHPSLANDNLTGIATEALLAREMRPKFRIFILFPYSCPG